MFMLHYFSYLCFIIVLVVKIKQLLCFMRLLHFNDRSKVIVQRKLISYAHRLQTFRLE